MASNETDGYFVTTAGSRNSSASSAIFIPEGCTLLRFADFNPFDNPDSLISQDQERIFAAIIASVLRPVFFLVGFPGNIITAIAFYRHGLQERLNLCVFCQTLIDICYIINAMFAGGDSIIYGFNNKGKPNIVGDWYLKNYLNGLFGLDTSSKVLSAIIACERCFCVARPLKAKTFMKTGTMATIIVIVTVVFTGGHFVVGTRWSVGCLYNPATNSTLTARVLSDFYLENKYLVDFVDVFAYGIVIPGTCMTVVSVTTSYTAFKLKQMTAWRQKSASSTAILSRQEVALTRMLVGTSVLFIVCTVSYFCSRVVLPFYPEFNLNGRQANMFILISYLNLMLTFFRPTLNVFVFYALGSRFRNTVRRMFCGSNMDSNSESKVEFVSAEITGHTAF